MSEELENVERTIPEQRLITEGHEHYDLYEQVVNERLIAFNSDPEQAAIIWNMDIGLPGAFVSSYHLDKSGDVFVKLPVMVGVNGDFKKCFVRDKTRDFKVLTIEQLEVETAHE